MNIIKGIYKEVEEWVFELLVLWFYLVAFIVGVAVVFLPVWLTLYVVINFGGWVGL